MKKRSPIFSTLFWIAISFMTLFPIYWLFVISVKPAVQLFSTPELLLTDPYWGNYTKVMGDRLIRSYMLNSMLISTGNAFLCTTLGFLACYALSRFNLSGKESIFFWTITNRMAPPAVFLLPLFLLMTQVYRIGDSNLLDSRIGMMLVYCTFNLPFAIWTLRPTVDGIPRELDEAAFVDGASGWQVIAQIVFPLCRPGLAVTLILTWVFAWNEYLLAATLTNFNARTLTTALSEYVTTTGTEWGIMATISVFTLLPALLVFGLVQKHIVAGLTFGAVKG